MHRNVSILKILESLNKNEATHSEINDLIISIFNFAFFYLKHSNKNIHKVLLAEDITLKEMALDAIASLFERDDFGKFPKLLKSFNEWTPKIDTEEKALFYINRLAAKSVQKYISRLLRESDPIFSKILDSVNYQLEKQAYKKKNILGTVYIVESNKVHLTGSMPDHDFINNLNYKIFIDKNKMLPEIFESIKESNKTSAIPLNALIMKLKQIRFHYSSLSNYSENGEDIEIESILNNAFNKTLEKLNDSYLLKNKVNLGEVEIIKKALENIIIDVKDGGISVGIQKYILDQDTGITYEYYKEKYQNMFEYLVKLFKKHIMEHLN